MVKVFITFLSYLCREILWQDIWDRLSSKSLFLTILTEHIENGEISRIAPSVCQSLCEHWVKISPPKLEELILRLDWDCLDLHQVLSISKRENLYRAQMHLNTKALQDYIVSLTELIPLIPGNQNLSLGNSILVYISSCLAGRGYPTGDIAVDIIQNVKHEVLRCLTAIHSNGAADDELPYPYFRILLKFDTRETLNVLSLAFQEKEFDGLLGQSHRQRIVNILLEIMTPDQATWAEIGCLLNFISKQISSKCLPDDDILLDKIVRYLSMESIEGETARQHSEREQAWLELLTSDVLTYLTTGQLLDMAKRSKCYRVVEYLYEVTKNYEKILECYILDNYRHFEIFTYIRKYASNQNRRVRQQLKEHFDVIFSINQEETVKIIVDFYYDEIKDFIKLLENSQRNTFTFLANLVKLNVKLDTDYSETYIKLLCKFNPENVEMFLRVNDTYRLDTAIEIVKEFELNSVYIYLLEKKGDYQTAFNISIELLKEAPESMAENFALDCASLCSRASEVLSVNEKESLWFSLLNIVLSRPDLSQITKNILHSSSRYVDLKNLVQLVLSSAGTKDNNYGDIKHLLVGMLSNSKYETLLLQTTSKILGHDLHKQFAKEKRVSNQGLYIKSIKCVICRLKLFNKSSILIYGSCGHAIHKDCCQKRDEGDVIECPRCGVIVKELNSIELVEPKLHIGVVEERDSDNNDYESSLPIGSGQWR